MPPRPRLTVGTGLAVAANLGFLAEVWPRTPGAEAMGWAALLTVCTACLCQVAAVLNKWGRPMPGRGGRG